MTTRTVAQVIDATNERVGPFKIKNALPTRSLNQVDPFLLIHHMQPYRVTAGADLRIPPHPHAGFEVVTYLLQGQFFHRDSKGHDQVAGPGDMNWMTSGSGIVHSEGPTSEFLKEGGYAELLQVWINLPAEKKSLGASFRHYPAEKFPVETIGNAQLKILLGGFADKVSPVSTHTEMFWFHVDASADQLITLPVKDSYQAGVYVLAGAATILNETVSAGQLAEFSNNGDQLVLKLQAGTSLMVFGGEPIKEKVVSYGPFVMNSFAEVQQAIEDYERGKMGTLSY
jgi:redox-sensitive bicupin YhaK (pirin superfamily)